MRILITGAARAIGAATAAVLAARGHDVVATARDVRMLDDLPAAQRLRLDVCDLESIRGALEVAGELDAVVNNAAITAGGPLEGFPLGLLGSLFETNALGPLRVVGELLPAWRKRGHGVIVNVSSVQGRISTPLEGPYCASKFALEALSETLHYELGHFGIRVVIVEPGYIAPGMKQSPRHEGPTAYAELWSQWAGIDSKLTGPGGRSDPRMVGEAIAQAIEDPATPLRLPVGADAQTILELRRALDDDAFEKAMRDALDVSW